MRHSNHGAGPGLLGVVLVAAVAAACADAPPPPSATPRPTPVITPDPHLTEPASADEVFIAIGSAGLPLVANNATAGDASRPYRKRINAEFGNWPLTITEFPSATALRQAIGWDPARPPVQGHPPYAFVGLNILVEFGPSTGARLGPPDENRQAQATELVALLHGLLSPIEQRSLVPVALPTPRPAPASALPSAAAAGIAP